MSADRQPLSTRAGGSTREALLEAAEALFAELGYAGVGMRELCTRAGANLSAVQYHFGGKRELYLETVRRVMSRHGAQEAWGALEPVPADRDGAARALVRFVRGLFSGLAARGLPSCVRLILHEAMRPSEALDDVVSNFTKPNVELLARVLGRLSPRASEAELESAARSVVGQVMHYILLRPMMERSSALDLADPATARAVADHVARFSLRGLACDEDLVERALAAADGPAAVTPSTGPGPSAPRPEDPR